MVEVEAGMGEVEDTDQSRRTLTSPLRVTNTTVASLTHLAEGATQATVRTREKERERERAWLVGRELLCSFSIQCRDGQCSAVTSCTFPPTYSQRIAWCP